MTAVTLSSEILPFLFRASILLPSIRYARLDFRRSFLDWLSGLRSMLWDRLYMAETVPPAESLCTCHSAFALPFPLSELLPSIAGLSRSYSLPRRSNRHRCSLPLGFGSGLHWGEGLLVGTQLAIALFRYVASSTAHCHGARRKDFNRYRMTTAMTLRFKSCMDSHLAVRLGNVPGHAYVLLSAMPARCSFTCPADIIERGDRCLFIALILYVYLAMLSAHLFFLHKVTSSFTEQGQARLPEKSPALRVVLFHSNPCTDVRLHDVWFVRKN